MRKTWQIVKPKDFYTTQNEYKINGRNYVRTTKAFDALHNHAIERWKNAIGKEEADRILATRQNIGTITHKLFEMHLKKESFNLGEFEEEIQDNVNNFIPFSKDVKLKPEGLEQSLWSNEHGYAGTADYLGKYTSNPKYLKRGHKPLFPDGAFVIGDWKTSKAIYHKHKMQLAAYAYAFFELTGVFPDGGFVAVFRNNKVIVEEISKEELVIQFQIYVAVLTAYKGTRMIDEFAVLRKRKKK